MLPFLPMRGMTRSDAATVRWRVYVEASVKPTSVYEATVQYVMSPYGVLLPSTIEQQELRDGQVTSESKFVYANFHKFQTSSDIKFGDVP